MMTNFPKHNAFQVHSQSDILNGIHPRQLQNSFFVFSKTSAEEFRSSKSCLSCQWSKLDGSKQTDFYLIALFRVSTQQNELSLFLLHSFLLQVHLSLSRGPSHKKKTKRKGNARHLLTRKKKLDSTRFAIDCFYSDFTIPVSISI